jgi:hypothetical protein
MIRKLIAILIMVMPALALAEEAVKVRVGTFDTRAVALAYGRSPRPDCLMAKVAELHKQHEQAKKEGNEELVAKLEIEGPALQQKMHEMVFSDAPIPEILAMIEDDLPAIAEAAGVDMIVEGVLHSGPGVEVVDISMEMTAPFQIDEKTKQMIPQVLATDPVPLDKLKHDH